MCLGAASPGASAHHATDGAAEHIAEDSVTHTPAEEASLQRSTALATQADAARAAAAVAGDEHQVGSWGPVVDWPVVGVHVALMPNGKVLAYDSVGDNATETYPVHDHTRATVWDPATGTQTPVNVNTGFNVFCSGLAHLPDGSLFLAGGNKNAQLHGIRQTHIFNPTTNAWSLGPDMAGERWYPSVTPLSNGEMLITEGGPDIPGGARDRRRAAAAERARRRTFRYYPWLDVAPERTHLLLRTESDDAQPRPRGAGAWQTFGERDDVDRDYGSRAMYDIGKLLVAGGGPSTKSATVIDVNGASPQADADRADGSSAAASTTSRCSPTAACSRPAASRPARTSWISTTASTRPSCGIRGPAVEHARADARSPASTTRPPCCCPTAGCSPPGAASAATCDSQSYLAKNAQVFTPPYLFKKDGSGELAPRPAISSAPGVVHYGGQVRFSTPNAASISRVALVRLGAVTHSVDMEQRFIPLSINARDSGRVRATGPANANIAPPGPYMLFAINAEGVPSVARMVTVAAGNPPPNQDPEAVLDADTATGTRTAERELRRPAARDDPDGDPLSYSWNFGDGGTSTAEAPTHNYSEPGTYTARLTVSDGLGGTGTASRPVSVREPGLPDPIAPGSPDTTGPALRLLGVNAARGRIRGSAADPAGVEAVSVALRRSSPVVAAAGGSRANAT